MKLSGQAVHHLTGRAEKRKKERKF